MFEGISIFFAAIVWWEIIGLIFISFLMIGFMWNEHGGVPFVGLVVLSFYSWTGNGALINPISLMDMWLYIIIYLLIGLLWSAIFKWRGKVKFFINKYENEEDVRYALKHISNDTIIYWVVWWPFSVLGFIFDDVIDWIIEHFKGIYNMITDSLISSAISNNNLKKTKEFDEFNQNDSDMHAYFDKKRV
jgi:hypothetical protein